MTEEYHVQIMKKIVIAQYEQTAIAALMENGRPVTLGFLSDAGSFQAGTVIIGRVEQVKKELNAAFVSIAPGVPAYLQLKDAVPYKQGDLVPVLIERPAGRNKRIQVSDRLSLYGKNVAILEGKKPVGISARITEETRRDRLRALMQGWLSDHADADVTAIVRTNAVFAEEEEILDEADSLLGQLLEIRQRAPFCTQYTVLHAAENETLKLIRDNDGPEPLELVTDIPAVLTEAEEYIGRMGSSLKASLYEDPQLPLFKLYSLDYAVRNALEKKVWLRSGGYLVIEHTEALTVIDVNTGKYTPKGSGAGTFLKLNLEAAEEAARQLRLRNISGIIIVDFIDMKESDEKEQLIRAIREAIVKDPIKTSFHGLTALGLAELTRKKTSPPLAEQAVKQDFFRNMQRDKKE